MPIHPFKPIYDEKSRVLVLGSFPSVKSRENGFYYGHPQNRFWRVAAAVFDSPVPSSIPEKTALLLSHGVALWDVAASCEVTGSSDNTIKRATPNDIAALLRASQITRIYANGRTAYMLYEKLIHDTAGISAVCLPSTSPANAAWSFDRLVEAWRVIAE